MNGGFDARVREEPIIFQRVDGIQKLANLVRKLALTSYGSDSWNPDTGCYLRSMIGSSYSSLNEVARDINREVDRISTQIKKIQMNRKIPREEMLASLVFQKIEENKDGDLWGVSATYLLINKAGERLEVIIP